MGGTAAVDVTAVVVAVLTGIKLLVLGLEDEVAEEVARKADCEDEDDVTGVDPVAVRIEVEGLVVLIAPSLG